MKIEARGKYAGVKVHLDGDEAQQFLDLVRLKGEGKQANKAEERAITFAHKLGKKIDKLIEEVPNLLEDRTEEQIQASMEKDLDKILEQKKAIAAGKDWKKV